jgi:hypothetical protein
MGCKDENAFPLHVMEASRANITPKKHYFVSYTKFANSETIVLSNKNVLLQAEVKVS